MQAAQIIGVAMALILAFAALRSHQIKARDGIAMAVLWGFLLLATTLVFLALGW